MMRRFAAIVGVWLVAWAVPAIGAPPSFQGLTTPVLPPGDLQPAQPRGWLPQAFGTPTRAAGNVNVLVLLIHYSDRLPAERTDDPAYFESMLFGTDNGTTDPYPFKSMRTYYAEQSNGALQVTGTVVGWLAAPETQRYYARKNGDNDNGRHGLGDGFSVLTAERGGARALVREALDQAVTGAAIDLDAFDGDGDDVIDAVMVIHTGPGAEMTGERDDLWSHQLQSTFTLADGESYNVRYLVGAERFVWPPQNNRECPSGIGVLAHEFGHILGLPDINDAGGQGNGIGFFGVMGWGLYNWDGVDETAFCPDIEPTAFSPWARQDLAWQPVSRVTQNQCELALTPLNDGGSMVEVPLGDQDRSERFLLGFARPESWWKLYGRRAVSIWHIDDAAAPPLALTNGPACVPQGDNDCREDHYWISLEQADGRYDLEGGVNLGEGADLWLPGDGLTPPGALSSCSWDREDCTKRFEVLDVTPDRALVRVIADARFLPPPPEVLGTPPAQAVVGETYRFTPAPVSGSAIRWRLVRGPAAMTVNGETGEVVWTPAAEGRFRISVLVTTCSGEDTLSWMVDVGEGNGRAPDVGGGGGCSLVGGAPARAWPTFLMVIGMVVWARRRLARPCYT